MKFHHCWLTPGKKCLATSWPNPLLSFLEKSLRRPCSFVCKSGLLKLLCTCPTIHQTHHFATPHLCWCNNKFYK